MPKKRKISGLTGIELEQALDSLKKYRQCINVTEEGGEGEDADEENIGYTKHLDQIIDKMESRTSGSRFNIVVSGYLRLKSNHTELVQQSKLAGKDGLWSSTQMYHHLELLEKLIPKENEAGARVWIDTFLFRASAMLPPGYRMVLNTEQSMPATTIEPSSLATISGFADYTVVVATDEAADVYYHAPRITTALMVNAGFFVTEAKSGPLHQHLPQAVCELYASGKQLGKDTIRGALTNGHDWVFIILYFGTDGKSASYKHSSVVCYPVSGDKKPEDPYPDIIAGILSYWTQKSFDDIDEDDWFEFFRSK